MRDSVGSVALYYIIIVFLIIVFAFLAGTISYSKAFRVNSRIVNSLEKYEGYNKEASAEIDQVLGNIGYQKNTSSNVVSASNANCHTKDGRQAYTAISGTYAYCVYEIKDTRADYYHWGILTYLYIGIPVVGDMLKIPIYSESDSFYRFPLVAPSIDDSNM